MKKYKKDLNNSINISTQAGICCYTDRSSTDQGVGGGFLTTNLNNTTTELSFKLKDCFSVFQAEVTAIHEGAKQLLNTANIMITFWSDNLSALQALSKITP